MSTNKKVVYEVRRGDDNSHVFYVGQGDERRTKMVCSSRRSKEFIEEVENHGYLFKIIARDLSGEESKALEVKTILKYGRIDLGTGTLVNRSPGGEPTHFQGSKHTDETKAKLSKAKMGNSYTLGYKHSDESRERMSKAQKGVPKSPEHIANMKAGIRAYMKKLGKVLHRCPHCGKEMHYMGLIRWHGNNCKDNV